MHLNIKNMKSYKLLSSCRCKYFLRQAHFLRNELMSPVAVDASTDS